MGFTTGFTGGVTLTLSIAYLTVLSHQRHREHQAAILRQQTRVLSSLVDPLPPPLPPTRSEVAAAERETLVERAKDRWNAEVEGAVRWAQTKDWDEVREDLETAVGRLWARAFGESLEKAEQGEAKVRDVASEAKTSVAAAAKSAYADAKAKGSEAAAKTGEKAEEAKGSIFSSIGSLFGRGKEAASQAVGIAKKKAEEVSSTSSAEEKALAQRYKGSSSLNQSPEEVLAARYQGSNTQLKA